MIKIFFLAIIFINAFVDIGHKITLQNIAFKLYDGSEQIILVSVINALILLPFILLFSPSGFMSDKYPKEKIMKYGALAAVIISLGLLGTYITGWFYASFMLLFLLAVQSAFYSPAKFGYIKSLYGKENLSLGNSLAQAVSTISILVSMAIYSFIFEKLFTNIESTTCATNGIAGIAVGGCVVPPPLSPEILLGTMVPIAISLVILSSIEFLLTFCMPNFVKKNEEIKFSIKEYAKLSLLKDNIVKIKSGDGVFLSIIALSVFYAVVQGIFAVFPAYAKEHLEITNILIINGMIATAGLGIVIGALLYSRYSKHFIELGTIPMASIMMTVILFGIITVTNTTLLFGLFFAFGLMGGLFIIPLNSLIQFNTDLKNLGSVLAGNNWFQSLAMFVTLIATTTFAIMQINSLIILNILLIILAIGALYTMVKLPQSLIQFMLARLVNSRYKVIVNGIDNIPATGPILFLGNHISFLDWAILQISSPRRMKFVMDKTIYNKWYFHHFLKWFGAIPVSGAGSKEALANIAKALDDGDAVCIFPEGAITRNGHLGEFKKGYEKVIELTQEDTDVKIIPFFLQGLWGTMFSRANQHYIKKIDKYFEVSCTFGTPLNKTTNTDILKKKIFDLSVNSWNNYFETTGSIPEEVIKKTKLVNSQMLMADSTGLKLSGTKTLGLAITMINSLKSKIEGDNVGLIVPSTVIGNISNLSLLMLGKKLINLNYTNNIESLIASAEVADIKTIIASRKFVQKIIGKGFNITPLLESVKVIYLEDLKPELSKSKILINVLKAKFLSTKCLINLYTEKTKANDTAVILFSSGSEGTPKGIELTHKNLIANIKQVSNVLDANQDDVILGNLPIFHAFGLTVTTLMPMVEGIPVVSHPDPTDGFGIGKLVSTYKATIMCGTSTFLRLYTGNRKVQPLMFDSLRMVIAGAEKLDKKVSEGFKKKFGKDVLEGYGATETSPVASVNIPDRLTADWKVQVGNKVGTVGMPMPGTSIRIVSPEELFDYMENKTETVSSLPTNEEGMILISGPQVMKSYLNNETKTKEALVIIDDMKWYISGDKGKIDEHGFLTIVDRYSRFAKLGGEMISLTAVENTISNIVNNELFDSIAVNIPDDKKGEKIVLLYENYTEIDDKELIDTIKKGFENKLMCPSEFIKVENLPKLGTGKKDFKTAKTNVIEKTV